MVELETIVSQGRKGTHDIFFIIFIFGASSLATFFWKLMTAQRERWNMEWDSDDNHDKASWVKHNQEYFYVCEAKRKCRYRSYTS